MLPAQPPCHPNNTSHNLISELEKKNANFGEENWQTYSNYSPRLYRRVFSLKSLYIVRQRTRGPLRPVLAEPFTEILLLLLSVRRIPVSVIVE